jgi:hypothetical protein
VGDIPARLAAIFADKAAYKTIPGKLGLTDISIGYMLERITEVFGPAGVGWTLRWAKEDFTIEGEIIASRKKEESAAVLAWLKYAEFVYYIFSQDGNVVECVIPTSGMSINEVSYAEEGARTAALGSAVKKLCFQIGVYKGDFDHGKRPAAVQEKIDNKQASRRKPATKADEPAEKEKAPEAAQAAKPNGGFDFNVLNESHLKAALGYKIPEGYPLTGETIEVAITDKNIQMGRQVIGYFAGKIKGPKDKKYFKPESDEQKKLFQAALYVWIHKNLSEKKATQPE